MGIFSDLWFTFRRSCISVCSLTFSWDFWSVHSITTLATTAQKYWAILVSSFSTCCFSCTPRWQLPFCRVSSFTQDTIFLVKKTKNNDKHEKTRKLESKFIWYFVLVPLEMPVLLKENFNRWYSLRSYYLAITVSDIPFQVNKQVDYIKTGFCKPYLTNWWTVLHFRRYSVLYTSR